MKRIDAEASASILSGVPRALVGRVYWYSQGMIGASRRLAFPFVLAVGRMPSTAFYSGGDRRIFER